MNAVLVNLAACFLSILDLRNSPCVTRLMHGAQRCYSGWRTVESLQWSRSVQAYLLDGGLDVVVAGRLV